MYIDNIKFYINDYYVVFFVLFFVGVGVGVILIIYFVGMDYINCDLMVFIVVFLVIIRMSLLSFIGSDVIFFIMVIFFFLVVVFLKRGCDVYFFINILFMILVWLLGMIYVFYVVVRYFGDLGDWRVRKGEGKRGI